MTNIKQEKKLRRNLEDLHEQSDKLDNPKLKEAVRALTRDLDTLDFPILKRIASQQEVYEAFIILNDNKSDVDSLYSEIGITVSKSTLVTEQDEAPVPEKAANTNIPTRRNRSSAQEYTYQPKYISTSRDNNKGILDNILSPLGFGEKTIGGFKGAFGMAEGIGKGIANIAKGGSTPWALLLGLGMGLWNMTKKGPAGGLFSGLMWFVGTLLITSFFGKLTDRGNDQSYENRITENNLNANDLSFENVPESTVSLN